MVFFKKIIIILMILFLIYSFIKNINQYQKSINFYNQFKNEYEKEKYKNIKLKTEIIKKKSLYEIEKIIRNQLNLTKKNEYIILLPSPSVNKPSPSVTPFPNYLQWWHLFAKNH